MIIVFIIYRFMCGKPNKSSEYGGRSKSALDDWETYVQKKEAIPKTARQFCALPKQTTS